MSDYSIIGCPYPVTKNALGFLSPQRGINQIKSDLLILLLTNPGERVMNPEYGTPLRKYLFDQNDPTVASTVRQLIINSINTWEKRIVVQNITVTNQVDTSYLNSNDTGAQSGNILQIIIQFTEPGNLTNTQNLTLELPLSGS